MLKHWILHDTIERILSMWHLLIWDERHPNSKRNIYKSSVSGSDPVFFGLLAIREALSTEFFIVDNEAVLGHTLNYWSLFPLLSLAWLFNHQVTLMSYPFNSSDPSQKLISLTNVYSSVYIILFLFMVILM